MIETIKATDHAEWLTLRRRGLGSSEVGTILGLSKFDTPYRLWLRKTDREGAIPENTAMRMGHLLEPVVAQLYAEATGAVIDPETECDFVVINDRKPYMVASPDRYATTADGQKLIVECKTTSLRVSDEDYPKSWFCQVQYLMATAEIDYAVIAYLIGGRDFGTIPVVRNDKFIDFMLDKTDKFWNDNVLGGVAPEVTTDEDVARKYISETQGTICTATPEIYDTYKRLVEVKDKIDELETLQTNLETAIKIHMAEAERLEYGDTLLATWKTAKGRSTFDSIAFREAHPDLAKQFTKTTASTRRFTLKKQK